MPATTGEIVAASERMHIAMPVFFRRRLVARLSGITIVAFLIAGLRAEIITSPPYYDFVIGIWPEAQFLADTNFDYRSLRYEESHSLDRHGGKRSYMTSVIPTLLACLLKVWPDSLVPLAVYHCGIFICAAIALVLLYELLVPVAGPWGSLAAGLAVATTPVFAVQMDMTGMEMPLIAAVMVSLWLLMHGCVVWCALMTLVAFLIKPTGLLATVTLLLLVSLQIWSRPRSAPAPRGLRRGMSVLLACLFSELFLLRWGSSIHAQLAAGPPLWMLAVWSPDVVLLLAASAACLMWRLRAEWKCHTGQPYRERIYHIVSGHRGMLYAAGFAFAVFASLESVRFVPRYVACTVPFLYYVLCGSMMRGPAVRPVLTTLLMLVGAANLVNWNGVLFPNPSGMVARYLGEPAARLSREGSFLERSHEYLVDHRQNQEVVRYLSTHCRGETLIVGIPFAYFLAYPCMGYVREAMPAYVINGFVDGAPGFRDASSLLRDLPRRPIFVITSNGFYHDTTRLAIPPPTDSDEILIAYDADGPMAFRKEWHFTPTTEDLAAWYLSLLWPDDSEGAQAFLRARSDRRGWERPGLESQAEARRQYVLLQSASRLAEVGLEDLAAVLYFHVIIETRDRWGDRTDREFPAAPEADRNVNQKLAVLPRSSDARLEAAELCAESGAWRRAVHFLLIDLAQRLPFVAAILEHYEASSAAMLRGDVRGAERALSEGIAMAPQFAPFWSLLGELKLSEGKTDEAIQASTRATTLAENSGSAHYLLGLARMRQGRCQEGIKSLEKGVQLDPFQVDALNTLRKSIRCKK